MYLSRRVPALQAEPPQSGRSPLLIRREGAEPLPALTVHNKPMFAIDARDKYRCTFIC